MTADEWRALVIAAAQTYWPAALIDSPVVRATRVKIRLKIDEERLLDLFFREETGRIDYSLIVGGQRAFGIDNLGGWHEHPLDDPDGHIPCDEPTPGEALRRLKAASDILPKSPAA